MNNTETRNFMKEKRKIIEHVFFICMNETINHFGCFMNGFEKEKIKSHTCCLTLS
jgi:hypothetical protein